MILVIDDAPEICEFVREALAQEGYPVRACGPREGLALALASPPELILLDVLMPGLSGPQLAEELRRHEATHDIPIVVMSAYDASNWPGHLLIARALLQKPFHLADLVAVVRSIIGPSEGKKP